jgi:hypothetical protein
MVKCNALISEIVAFLSRYDPTVYAGMEVQSEMAGIKFNWFATYTFGEPIDVDVVRWVFSTLLAISEHLTKHLPEHGDNAIPKHALGANLNTGYHRRLQLIREISDGPGSKISFRKIANLLNRIVKDENPRYLLKPVDPTLEYLTPEYLGDLAMDIHDDIERILNACQHPPTDVEYNYQGPPAPRKP